MKQILSVSVSEIPWTREEIKSRAHRLDLVHLRDVEVPNDKEGEPARTFALYHGYDGKLTVFQVDPNGE